MERGGQTRPGKVCFFDMLNVERERETERDYLLPFVQFRKHEKQPWRKLLTFNFTKCNTPPWVFFMFFKLSKCYQIVQRITYGSYNLTVWIQIDKILLPHRRISALKILWSSKLAKLHIAAYFEKSQLSLLILNFFGLENQDISLKIASNIWLTIFRSSKLFLQNGLMWLLKCDLFFCWTG